MGGCSESYGMFFYAEKVKYVIPMDRSLSMMWCSQCMISNCISRPEPHCAELGQNCLSICLEIRDPPCRSANATTECESRPAMRRAHVDRVCGSGFIRREAGWVGCVAVHATAYRFSRVQVIRDVKTAKYLFTKAMSSLHCVYGYHNSGWCVGGCTAALVR
jgi:hypothetical protein